MAHNRFAITFSVLEVPLNNMHELCNTQRMGKCTKNTQDMQIAKEIYLILTTPYIALEVIPVYTRDLPVTIITLYVAAAATIVCFIGHTSGRQKQGPHVQYNIDAKKFENTEID